MHMTMTFRTALAAIAALAFLVPFAFGLWATLNGPDGNTLVCMAAIAAIAYWLDH